MVEADAVKHHELERTADSIGAARCEIKHGTVFVDVVGAARR